jgi:FAD/FMN-containing dehydrogenase
VLRYASETHIPVVPRGAGFSVTGYGVRAAEAPIVVDSRRLSRVLDIDDVNMTITAEVGIRNGDLQQAAAEHGFRVQTVAVPLWQTTLGGSLSGVLGGGVPAESPLVGGNTDAVLGLTVVLADGRVVQTNAGGSNVHRHTSVVTGAGGPNLTSMFLGDGGVLGYKVEATLKLIPDLPLQSGSAWRFPSLAAAWSATCELMTIPSPVVSSLGTSDVDGWVMLACAEDSDVVRLRSRESQIARVASQWGGRPGDPDLGVEAEAMARGDARWSERFLSLRRGIIAFVAGRSDFLETFEAARSLLRERIQRADLAGRVQISSHFSPYTRHAAYASLSVVMDSEDPDLSNAVPPIMRECYELLISRGAHSEFHQGESSQLSAQAWSPDYRWLVDAVRSALDPAGILSPRLWAPRGSGD